MQAWRIRRDGRDSGSRESRGAYHLDHDAIHAVRSNQAMKRFLIGALVAYALSATLLVAWWGARASSLRVLVDAPSIRQAKEEGKPAVSKGLRTLFLDQGVETSGW